MRGMPSRMSACVLARVSKMPGMVTANRMSRMTAVSDVTSIMSGMPGMLRPHAMMQHSRQRQKDQPGEARYHKSQKKEHLRHLPSALAAVRLPYLARMECLFNRQLSTIISRSIIHRKGESSKQI